MPALFSVLSSSSCCCLRPSFSKADPKQAVRVLRYIGGGAVLLFAVFLLVRGAIVPAVSIGLIGLGCSAMAHSGGQASGGAHRKARVRPPACVQPPSKWSSTTTAAPCAVGF